MSYIYSIYIVSYGSSIREFPVMWHSALLIQKLFLNSSIVFSLTCFLWYVCLVFFKSFFIFIIVLVGNIIALSNCSLFFVFHIWQSIAVVSVSTSFLVLDGSYKAEIVHMCCSEVYSFCIRFLKYFWR